MEQLPVFTGIFFGLTTIMTVLLFYRAAHYSRTVLRILSGWLLLQGIIALTGFYTVTDSMPPRFVLLAGPPLVFTILLFCTQQGRAFMDGLDLQTLTMLHIIRIPVELVLFWLFFFGVVPEVMTFEGRNFDILSGLTAPLIFYFVFVKNKLGNKTLLIWNFICLGLLFNIVLHAVLSAPSPFQKMAFEQPNVAVLHFPFVWLPCCVVPLVLLSHLAAMRQLIKN